MTTRKFLVTGGGGFVGKGICKFLLSRGDKVVSVSRNFYPELEELGVTQIQGDLSTISNDKWRSILPGITGVFHTAAKVEMWGNRDDFIQVNVTGTMNILEACRASDIKALVFTSSPSVIANGSDLRGVNESYPYPHEWEAYYPETKAIAEIAVLKADTVNSLRTLALRPHLIWGPGDTNLIPTILERARAGKLVKVGRGKNKTDLTFIDDCVRAHILAMDTLLNNPERVAGKAYFISQGDPVLMWNWIDQILVKYGLSPIRKSIPLSLAMFLARLSEAVFFILNKLGIKASPRLTKFLVSEMATDHYFDISNAKKDFGYQPSCTIAEAMERL